MEKSALIEQLAEKEHAGWSHWMEYLFSVCIREPGGALVIPAEFVERWQRQLQTPYPLLTENEKQSDRNEVAHILPLIDEYAHRVSSNSVVHAATLDDIKALAAQMDILFTEYAQAFDLDSKPDAPLRLEATYRKVQAGIDIAYNTLVRLMANLSKLPSHQQGRSDRT